MANCFIFRTLTACVLGLLATQLTAAAVTESQSQQETTEKKQVLGKLNGSAPDQNTTSSEPVEPAARRPRLPRYFGQLGVDEDQRKKIYSIQEKYDLQISKLLEELEALRSARDKQCLAVLSAAQQKELGELSARPNNRHSSDETTRVAGSGESK